MIPVSWCTTCIATNDFLFPRLDRLLRSSQALVSLGNLQLRSLDVQRCLFHRELLNVALKSILQLLSIAVFHFLALFAKLFDKLPSLLLLLFLFMPMVESLRSLLLDSHDLVVLYLL